MPKPRRTVAVSYILHRANEFLRTSPPHHDLHRLGVCELLETILHDTGNYRGFGYLEDVPPEMRDASRRVYLGDEGDAP